MCVVFASEVKALILTTALLICATTIVRVGATTFIIRRPYDHFLTGRTTHYTNVFPTYQNLSVLYHHWLATYGHAARKASINPVRSVQAVEPSIDPHSQFCQSGQFYCDSDDRCLDQIHICDTVKDCADGSDELLDFCNKRYCDLDQFRCRSGQCIARLHACNQHGPWIGCHDGSDLDPQMCRNRQCRADEFRCDSGQCIELSRRCDNVSSARDCMDLSDENSVMCSGECSNNLFRCANTTKCIYRRYPCDGEMDCPNGDDEDAEFCENRVCLPGEYKCDNGQCIITRKRCDRGPDCSDGTDETNCGIFIG